VRVKIEGSQDANEESAASLAEDVSDGRITFLFVFISRFNFCMFLHLFLTCGQFVLGLVLGC